jgi:hypothetical protein
MGQTKEKIMAADITGKDRLAECYHRTCKTLGFNPDVKFIRIHMDGSIGFAAGKPEEIMALHDACRKHGYRVHPNLQKRVDQLTGNY